MRRTHMFGISSMLMLLLLGCNSTQTSPPQATTGPVQFNIDGKLYTNEDQARQALKESFDKQLDSVQPVAKTIPGTLLFVQPTRDELKKTTTHITIAGGADFTPYLLFTSELRFQTDAKALEKAKLFDKVQQVSSDEAATIAPESYAYKLSREQAGNRVRFVLRKTGGGNTDLNVPNVTGNSYSSVYVAAVNNAAADLGAAVTRMPLPAQTQILPPPQNQTPNTQGLSTGTAFFINSGGFALTNAHVTAGCKSLKVALPDGETDATTIATDSSNDLSAIKLTNHGAPAFAHFHSGSSTRQGEEIVVYGFPLAGALASQGNLTTGIVSALAGIKDDSRFLQISAPVQPGNSGGPLLNEEGQVVGIVTAKANALAFARATGDIPQNVNFAIKSGIATGFLDSNGIKYETSHGKAMMHTADIGDLAKSFTYMVKCQH